MSGADDARPVLSPRELAAFERLILSDIDAALALCHPACANAEDLARANAALAEARTADAESNDGYGNRFAWAYAAWLAREPVSCGQQVAA